MESALFAFGFLNLAMLGWLAAGAVPVVIHLWSRRRYREERWAAMQYLLSAVRRRKRRLLLEQWLLLVIRSLVVMLVVLAVAQPYLEHRVFALASGERTHRVLVVDGSFSMAYRPAEKSRFEQAKEWAARIVEQSPKGDGFTLILMAAPPRVAVGTPAFETGEFLREIEGLRISHTTADLPATLSAVQKAIQAANRDNPRLVRHEVIFLTDLGRVGWAPAAGNEAAAHLRRLAEQLASVAALTIIDLGQPADNVAVTSLGVVESVVTARQNVHFVAQVKSFSSTPARRTLEWLVDGRHVSQEAVDLAPGRTASLSFSYRFDSAGDHALEVRLDPDRLELDDHRWLAVPVKEAISVLCIDGRPSGKPFAGAAGYLASALSPDHERERSLVRTSVASESAILEHDLGRYDAIFLSNVAQFTPSEARVLDAYLGAGGNLVFFLGDRVLPDRYNRELTGQSPGTPRVLPARLGRVAQEGSYRVDPLGYRHPAIQVFRGREKAGLLTTPVSRYCRLELDKGEKGREIKSSGNPPSPPAPLPTNLRSVSDGRGEPERPVSPASINARIVLGLTNGDPLIVEEPIRRGRSVVVATSADLTWSVMPLWPSFVPIVQELLAYCAGEEIQHQNILVGEPVEGSIPAAASASRGMVQRPDGGTSRLHLDTEGDYGRWSLADTATSGIYAVRVGPAPGPLFAVNVNTVESDLTQLSVDQLRSDVWPGIPFDYQTSWQDLVRPAAASAGRHGGLPIALLYAALGLVLLETSLARRAGHHAP
jgi:hypothetical protein